MANTNPNSAKATRKSNKAAKAAKLDENGLPVAKTPRTPKPRKAFPGFHNHPNGGGLVRDGANVSETAFVGPRVIILDATVTVEDSPRLDGLTVLKDTAKVAGNAVIVNSSVSNDAMVAGNANITDSIVEGNATIEGDAEIRKDSRIGGNAEISTGIFGAGSVILG